jgi:hypothetical protein
MEPYETSTKYFVLSINDKNNKEKIRFSVWALNPDIAIQSVIYFIMNTELHKLDVTYTLRVRKIRRRDRIDYIIPSH